MRIFRGGGQAKSGLKEDNRCPEKIRCRKESAPHRDARLLPTSIETFGNALTEDLFDDKKAKATIAFPPELRRVARRKLLYLHDTAGLEDLPVPPGNRLERLKGRWAGLYSIRINDQWRVVFRWRSGNAFDVQIVDYH